MVDYRKTKIKIKSPEHLEYVEKILLENGCKWGSNGRQVLQNLNKKQLLIWSDMEITYGCYSDEEFDNGVFKEIFIEIEEV